MLKAKKEDQIYKYEEMYFLILATKAKITDLKYY